MCIYFSDDGEMMGAHIVGVGHRLSHLPFIAELAALDDGDPASLAIRAGLLVLRFVDFRMEDVPRVATAESRRANAVRASIEKIATGVANRTLLLNVLDATMDPNALDGKSVWQRLMVYGRALDLDAQWKLAIDVYDTLLRHVGLEEDSESVVNALLRRGYCLREVGNLDEAEMSYEVATDQARRCGDIRGTLRAQIGKSKIVFARGNLPLADAILADTIRGANEHGLAEVRSLASHGRAQIAHARGEYDDALRYDFAALRESASDSERDRILNDLAATFVELGVFCGARDALLILAATAREQSQRWVSTINLMEIAAADGSMVQFEHYQQQLIGAQLPPNLRVEFELHVGRGYQLLSQFDLAREWLERSLRTAATHSLNRLVFAAEEALANDTVQNKRPIAPPANVNLDVVQIAEEMRVLREHALAMNE